MCNFEEWKRENEKTDKRKVMSWWDLHTGTRARLMANVDLVCFIQNQEQREKNIQTGFTEQMIDVQWTMIVKYKKREKNRFVQKQTENTVEVVTQRRRKKGNSTGKFHH